MIKLQGKRNSAIVFADKIDKQTKTQISELLREEAYADSKIRIMPDPGDRQHRQHHVCAVHPDRR